MELLRLHLGYVRLVMFFCFSLKGKFTIKGFLGCYHSQNILILPVNHHFSLSEAEEILMPEKWRENAGEIAVYCLIWLCSWILMQTLGRMSWTIWTKRLVPQGALSLLTADATSAEKAQPPVAWGRNCHSPRLPVLENTSKSLLLSLSAQRKNRDGAGKKGLEEQGIIGIFAIF